MSELIKLTKKYEKMYKNYINNNFYDNIYLAMDFSANLINDKNSKKSGDYYGFIKNEELLGVFVFSNSGILHMSYLDDEVLSKVDLLRAIKHYKPKVIKGSEENIQKLLKIIERSILEVKENSFEVMFYLGKKIEKIEKTDDLTNLILNNSNEFLVNLEKKFGRNPKLLNEIRAKNLEKYAKNEYFCYEDSGKIIAQGMLENIGDEYIIVGAIFTVGRYRKKGFATKILKNMVNEVLKRDKKPILLVNKKNENAINIYLNNGFENVSKFYIVEIKIK